MRIISGKARGTKIDTIESPSTRPTLDRVKESLFNIIQDDIKNSVVLDLFAGSGALGIESLSRGAIKAIFCDSNNDAIKVIDQNLAKTHLKERAEILNMDYMKCLKLLSKRNIECDIIFIDPPYKSDLAGKAIKAILSLNLLKTNGMMIVETDEITRDEKEINLLINSRDKIFEKIRIIDKRKYGRANLLFLIINEEN